MILLEIFDDVYRQHAFMVSKFADLVELLDLKQRKPWVRRYKQIDKMWHRAEDRRDRYEMKQAITQFEDLVGDLLFVA